MKSGVLNLRKPAGMTSHDAVDKVRRLYGTKKAGHTGTLDPQATGVLPILVGSAVKASEFVTAGEKVYRASLRFGMAFDTEDIWGKPLKESNALPSREAFESAIAAFPQNYDQVPPMYSALKVGGKKLYEYAREGKVIPREARRVRVEEIRLLSFSGGEAEIWVRCSKGTYIRTLICDLCKSCGALGAMSALERCQSGAFGLENAVSLSELEKMTPEEREEKLIPTEALFAEHREVVLADFFARLIRNGCAVFAKKCAPGMAFYEGERLRLSDSAGFFALGEARPDAEGMKIRKLKEF